MRLSFEALAPWIVLAAVLLASGALAAVRWGWRRTDVAPRGPSPAPGGEVAPPADQRALLRSYALDALSEAVLITDPAGQIRDCNSSALALFDRHRRAMEEQHASSVRRFEGVDQDDPHRMAAERAVWLGEAWARQADGGMKLCGVRVIAIRDDQGHVTGFVESYRDATADPAISEEFRDLLYGVRAFHAAAASDDEHVQAVREELQRLSEAFRDLDLVIRQYERVLPSLSADDPLAEAIAGAAAEARASVAAVGVPNLLERVPRSLARLRSHLQKLTGGRRETSGPAATEGASGAGEPTHSRSRTDEPNRSAAAVLRQAAR
ncbi:MAG TPA: PAS domain-containing protein [Gemmatimonadaceae bacterium]|nr:PAS domain-containing protein [Gemmatimonadaceae bacterium]